MSESLKHIVPSEAFSAIEPESILVEVHLQILRADVVINAANPVLCRAPETFNGVCVHVARDIRHAAHGVCAGAHNPSESADRKPLLRP
jgi:hypothetical protein